MNTQKLQNFFEKFNTDKAIKNYIFIMTFLIGGIFFCALTRIGIEAWYHTLFSFVVVLMNGISIRRSFKKLTKKG